MSYPHVDRFQSAVHVLAGEGNVKQRLTRAFQENLDEIPEDELPQSVKERFAELRSRLTKVNPLNGEGRVCASVRKMSAREASHCAESVVSLYGELLRSDGATLQISRKDSPPAEQAPPFLVKTAS